MSAPCPVLGFVVRATMDPSATESDVDTVVDELIALLERTGLVAGGGGKRTLEFVVHREGSQATDQDREIVRTWATEHTATQSIATIAVGPIIDVNIGA
jgi:uncharacterized protein YggL (DUF469 family)